MSALRLRGGWILGEDGTSSHEPQDVLIEGGVVAAVGPGLEVDEGGQVVDCTGLTVMPGLIDAHVHLAMAGPSEPDTTDAQRRAHVAANARTLLRSGVTTARDASGPSDLLLPQRAACAADPTAGPELLVTCEGIACPDGHGTEFTGVVIVREVAGPDEARAAVRRLVDLGADWVKVMLNGADDQLELDEPELAAIVEEARALGIPVAAHASNPAACALAVRCRVDSIEHGNDVDDDLATAMATADIALVTTTHVYRAGAGCTTPHGGEDPIAAFAPEVRDKVRGIMAVRVAGHERALPAASRAGVRIVLGTDAVSGPIDLAVRELQALHALGLSPAEALRAATTAGAELLGLPDRGRVAAGLRADLLLVRGRPDADLAVLGAPAMVLRGGVTVVDRRDGDAV